MTVVSFVLSNPNHHAEIMLPVIRDLARGGVRCQVVSLAELRGLETPAWDLDGVRVHRAFPRVRRNPSSGAGGGGRTTAARTLVRGAVWHGLVKPRLRWLLRGGRVIVVPNDVAFPYRAITEMSRRHGVQVVLIQEGIRFRLPVEHGDEAYGRSADRICAWGEGSADHFRSVGVPASAIQVTGNPRFDAIDPRTWLERRDGVLREASLGGPPLLYLSNPVDDQGFCSTDAKLALFERFVIEATPVLARHRIALAVRLHPREDRAAFQTIIDRIPTCKVRIVSGSLFDWLASARAAVVLTSTVGLEALAFGVPIGVLEIAGHGFAFEYVSRGAAVGIRADAIADGVEDLLTARRERDEAGAALLERHLAYRGEASRRVAAAIRALEVR